MAGTEDLAPEQRAQLAAGILRRTSGLTPAQYAEQQQQYMRGAGVLDMGRADELAKLTSRSDPEAAAQYTASRTGTDLRPGLAKIAAPVLVIAPYFELDETDPNSTMAGKAEYYRELMAGTPKLQVMGMPGTRHYAMIDQPERFTDALRGFLNSLVTRSAARHGGKNATSPPCLDRRSGPHITWLNAVRSGRSGAKRLGPCAAARHQHARAPRPPWRRPPAASSFSCAVPSASRTLAKKRSVMFMRVPSAVIR